MLKNVGVTDYDQAFLTCTIREIDNSRCVSYFSADPKENDRKLKNCMKMIYDYSKK